MQKAQLEYQVCLLLKMSSAPFQVIVLLSLENNTKLQKVLQIPFANTYHALLASAISKTNGFITCICKSDAHYLIVG